MSQPGASPLLSPFNLYGIPLANRVVMAPMTRARAGATRVPNPLMAEYYSQRASAGLIVSEGVTISPQANGWIGSPGLYTPEMAAAWKPLVDAVHAHGGRIYAQLWHGGRASHSSFHGGQLPVAPSALKIESDQIHTLSGKQPYETPRALETDEIPQVVADYRRAAQNAHDAGFDGVELHGANGYLIDEFLQSKTNLRTDRYGGSVENRFRFLGEIVEAVSGVWTAKRVGVRLSPNGVYNEMGSPDFRETFTHAARELGRLGVGYLHVMDGLAFGFHKLGEPVTLAELRPLFSGVMIGNCGYTQETAEQAIAQGDADLIAFGRPFISNPDLVARFVHGWPLNPPAEMSAWYSTGAAGYTDFPMHK